MSVYMIILLLLLPGMEDHKYPLKNGRPTSKGIDLYVEENADRLILEFQEFIDDTLYNTNIYTS